MWLALCTLCVQLTTAPNIEKNASSDGLIKQGGDIFLLIAMCCTEYHHSVLNGKCIEVVEHDMVGFWEQCRVTRNPSVFVKDDL